MEASGPVVVEVDLVDAVEPVDAVDLAVAPKQAGNFKVGGGWTRSSKTSGRGWGSGRRRGPSSYSLFRALFHIGERVYGVIR